MPSALMVNSPGLSPEETNTSFVPSGDQASPYAWTGRSTTLVTLRAFPSWATETVGPVAREERNAIRVPSGDHRG